MVVVVTGIKPHPNMQVELKPLAYSRRPEYWGIEVVGNIPGGFRPPAVLPYTASMSLFGIMGTKGIEVIGASRSQRIDVQPSVPEYPGNCNSWAAMHNHRPPGPPVLYVVGSCVFPHSGLWAELHRHEHQGKNPKDLLLQLVMSTWGFVPGSKVVEVSYSEATELEYETVTILPDGVSARVQRAT